MKVKFYGTRGSIAISNRESIKYGGNTTCIRIYSECLPKDLVMGIDGGTGFVPMSYDILREGVVKEVVLMFTHYHHDHILGLFLSPITFMKNIKLKLFGPVDGNIGVKKMMEDFMRPPYFPVHYKEVNSHITCMNLEFPRTLVILFHPHGYKIMNIDDFERITGSNGFIPIGKGKYPVEEFLVVTMYKSRHPEQTVSYRFEEKSTGKKFVFLTDHENEDGIPNSFKAHVEGVHLLVMDSQYSREKYDKMTAGYGHGTPDYCVRVAETLNVKKLGLTHHDPSSRDKDIEAILEEAKRASTKNDIQIFACADYEEVEV
ncbi:MAG TPA: MBL fold metallo-hydrolase [Candidatus Eremiobacteraeota bacterium]|nr:MAG: ribonuclease Z [bacterium ADurb.Bin363]HPZ07219.1 MBL fold metallo-hydrolase [Candidatus Eremiobacteraeota bacterium]